MKKIFKYQILGNFARLSMPVDAQILALQMQNDRPCVWALVVLGGCEIGVYEFGMYGTGHVIPADHGEYVGTLQDGPFVWHYFRRRVS